jgi:hypothetical protein
MAEANRTAGGFSHKTKDHQHVDHVLALKGHPPLRTIVTADKAADSWTEIARWIEGETGIRLTGAGVWKWFHTDIDVSTARRSARQAKARAS